MCVFGRSVNVVWLKWCLRCLRKSREVRMVGIDKVMDGIVGGEVRV